RVERRDPAAEGEAGHAQEGEGGEHLAGLQEPHGGRTEAPSADGPLGHVRGGPAAADEPERGDEQDADQRDRQRRAHGTTSGCCAGAGTASDQSTSSSGCRRPNSIQARAADSSSTQATVQTMTEGRPSQSTGRLTNGSQTVTSRATTGTTTM